MTQMLDHTEVEELPHDHYAERALMAGVARDPDSMASVLAQLPGDAFYSVPRGVVWDAVRAMVQVNEIVHPAAVGRWLVAHGKWDAKSLSGDVKHVVGIEMVQGDPLAALDARRHAATVQEMAQRRELIATATRARQLAWRGGGDTSEILARVRGLFDELDDGVPHRGPRGWGALVDEFDAIQRSGQGALVDTPWPELNDALGGLFAGRQYVIGGRPGQGKSTAALNMAMHSATQGKQTLVFSREMPAVDVTGRLIASRAGVPLREINARKLTDRSWDQIRLFLDQVGQPPITVDDRIAGIGEIKATARAHHHRHGLQVLVVDYLQLVTGAEGTKNRQEEVAYVSRECKALAMELEIATVIPAQLNRGNVHRADTRPTISDLRDSGQIEQDADAVILLHRPNDPDEPRQGEIDYILGKNRHGPEAVMTLRWIGSEGLIESMVPGARWDGS